MRALVVFHAAGAMDQPWKMQLIDYFTTKWSDERTDGKFEGKIEQPFTVVDDIPDRMTRGEAVRLAYKRNPYLRNLSDADLGGALESVRSPECVVVCDRRLR